PLPLACRYLSLTPFLSLPQRPARSTLFPYTTLFRSHFCGGILSIHQVTVLVHPEGFGVNEIAERKTRRLRGSACLASQRSVFQRNHPAVRIRIVGVDFLAAEDLGPPFTPLVMFLYSCSGLAPPDIPLALASADRDAP